MFERLIFEDFQRHERLAVNLDPSLTVFVGPNDAGKSAVFRAVRWLALNQPAGAGFVRHGAALASVAGRIDGRWVVRRRGEGVNVYEFDGETYHSLRAPSVPEAVEKWINLQPVNFQGQWDSPFWFLDTAGQVSRNLNEVINLGEIDAVLSRAVAEVRSAKEKVEADTQGLALAEAKLAETEWVIEFNEDLVRLEELAADLGTVREERVGLAALLRELVELEAELAGMKELLVVGEKAVAAGADATVYSAQRYVLAEILSDLDRLGREQRWLEDLPEEFDVLAGVRGGADQVAEEHRGLRHLLEDIDHLEDELCRLDADLTSGERELKRLTQGKCPLCGRPADPSRFCAPTSTSATGVPSPGASGARGTRSRSDTSPF